MRLIIMIPDKLNIEKLIVKYLFMISVVSIFISFFAKNLGAGIISIIVFVFCGVFLLISRKKQQFFDEVQNMF